MKDNIDQPETPTLLAELRDLVEAHRPAFGQERTFRRMVALLVAMVFCFARHTVTQLLLTLGLVDADWSAWYRLFSRERFSEEELAGIFLRQTLQDIPAEEPYVVGVDATQIPRSSQKMPGTSWLKAPRTPAFMPGIHRAQRVMIGQCLLPVEEGFSRAVPLRCYPAFPPKAVPAGVAPQTEWEAGLAFLTWTREQLDQAGREAQEILVVSDGSHECLGMWKGLPPRVTLLARSAKNRALYALPSAEERRRRRKYGQQALQPQQWLRQKAGWQQTTIMVRGHERRLTYRVEGPYLRKTVPDRPLFLIVVKGQTWYSGRHQQREHYREPAYYLVSAREREGQWCLPYTAETLLSWAWHRWELEVAHREMKAGLGVGQMQCWNERSALLSVQWAVWAYAVLVLAGYRTWGLLGGPPAPARWWPGAARWSLNTLWRAYRAELWGTGGFRALWSGSGDNWLSKEACLAGLWNAAAGAARA